MHKIYFIGFDGCMFYAVLLCFVRKQCNSYQPHHQLGSRLHTPPTTAHTPPIPTTAARKQYTHTRGARGNSRTNA
jgi:hypothetical protein